MARIQLGLLCDVLLGLIAVTTMIPLSFPDRRAAITAVFISRFGIGFVTGAAQLLLPGWISGLLFGLFLSLPDAIITKAYAPIGGWTLSTEQQLVLLSVAEVYKRSSKLCIDSFLACFCCDGQLALP